MKNLFTIRNLIACMLILLTQQLQAQTPSKIFEKSFGINYSAANKDIATDTSGNAYFWGLNGSQYYVGKTNLNGNLLWLLQGATNQNNVNNSYEININIHNMAVDASGNIYLAGIGYNPSLGNRLSVLKLNNSGVLQWQVFDTTASYSQSNTSITLDVNNNPVVACERNENCTKIYTVRYNKTNGVRTMAKIHDLVVGQCEYVRDIKTDSAGNIYIAGYVYVDNVKRNDIYVLKLNNAGNQQWVKMYDGNSNNDYGVDLVVDGSGNNIYVAGYGYFAATGNDWEIIKYNAAGTQVWARNIDGGGNSTDIADQIILDNAGFVFTVGKQYDPISGTVFRVVKLNPNTGGTTVTKTLGQCYNTNVFSHLACDATNRIYVSSGDYDMQNVTRLSNNLVTQYSWDDSQNFTYEAGIALTRNNEVFVIGVPIYNDELTKVTCLNNTGDLLYNLPIELTSQGGNDMLYDYTVDPEGNIYAAAYATDIYNLKVYKTNRNGDVIWSNSFNKGGFIAYDIKFDAVNNAIYVCGRRENNMSVIKYNATNGSRLWVASYNAPGNSIDYAYAMAVDNAGNVYLTGSGYSGSAEGNNCYTLKYNSNGIRQWVTEFKANTGVNMEDIGRAIALDGTGNVYVCGSGGVLNRSNEFIVLKYNNNGVLQYSKMLSGTNTNTSDDAYDIAVDNAGNAYVAGSYYGGAPEYYAAVLVKITPAGNVDFTKQFNGQTNQSYHEYFNRVILKGNNVYVTGTQKRDATVYDFDVFTVKFNTTGAQQWIKIFDNTNNTATHNFSQDLWVDNANNVYALAVSHDTLWTLLKYDSLGTQIWVYNYDRHHTQLSTSVLGYSYRPQLAADNFGGIYIGGTTYRGYNSYNNGFIRFCETPPVPTNTASGPLAFCAGGSVTLNASSGIGYLWTNGATTQSIVASSSGNYRVTVTYTNGCSNLSPNRNVTVNPLPTPVISGNGPLTFCAGNNVTLSTTSFASYLWSTGATTQSIVADTNGTFTVTVTNGNGCTGTATPVSTIENQLPNATATAQSPTTICSTDSVKLVANGGNNISYQWRRGNNNVTGATSKTYYAKLQGNYTVRVTNTNTGCSKTSTAINVVVNCKMLSADIAQTNLQAYPNPTTGLLHLTGTDMANDVVLSVYDAAGKCIISKTIQNQDGKLLYDIDLTQYPAGIYRLMLISNEQVLHKQAFKID